MCVHVGGRLYLLLYVDNQPSTTSSKRPVNSSNIQINSNGGMYPYTRVRYIPYGGKCQGIVTAI